MRLLYDLNKKWRCRRDCIDLKLLLMIRSFNHVVCIIVSAPFKKLRMLAPNPIRRISYSLSHSTHVYSYFW